MTDMSIDWIMAILFSCGAIFVNRRDVWSGESITRWNVTEGTP